MEVYLREVDREPMVSAEEEVILAKKIKNGDEAAVSKLVKANLRFVISVAKQYQNRGFDLEDLINEGNVGLLEAARRFDETRGFKFISYAVWWIRQSILKAIGEKSSSIRIPANRLLLVKKIARAALEIEQNLERKASINEIGELLKIDSSLVREIMESSQKQGAIDAPLAEGGESKTLSEVIEDVMVPKPTNGLMKESLKEDIGQMLSSLSYKEAEVLRMYYGIGLDYSYPIGDIGDKFSISKEQIRQIKNRALKKLRKVANLDQIRSYLK